MTRARWALLAWAIAAAALLPLAPSAATRLSVTGDDGGQAAWVERALATRFGSPFARQAVLVADGVDVRDSSGVATLRRIVAALDDAPQVLSVFSYLDLRDSAFVGQGGTFLVVGLAADTSAAETIVALRRVTSQLEAELRTRGRVELSWTGAPAIDRDVRLTSASDAAAAERRVLPLTAVLLVVVFGGIVAALVPIAAGSLAIALSLGAAAALAEYWRLTILLQNVASMIGLGLGIDYALLLVARFREALARLGDATAAAREARRTAGATVITSAATVAVGFAALLLIPAAELRSIAVGGLLVVIASALIATSLVPIALAWLGSRIDAGRVRIASRADGAEWWRRWGRVVVGRPGLALTLAGLPLVLLAMQAPRMRTDIPSGAWLPERMESTRGAQALSRMGRTGMIQTIRVIVELPEGTAATHDTAWRAVMRLSRALERDARVARVRSLPANLAAERPNLILLSMVPAEARIAYMSRDERLMLIELEPVESATPGALVRYVRELRAVHAATATGVRGTRMVVGGLPGANADYVDAVAGSARNVVLLVVLGTLAALFVGFRSILVPIKAVALNLLSVAAAMGATVLVFQDGYGARLVGLSGPIDGLFPAVPIIVFAIVFGLSMDYEVFLVDRVREGVRAGLSDADALVEGLARTGGVITSAALVMIVVFAGFAVGEFLIVKILGFALAAAVVIDATLVRMVVGPALLRLAGRWNWWPGRGR